MYSLYRRGRLFRYRLLRRLRYGRGHGVHSPMAYRLICSVAQPRAEYYLPTPQEDHLALWYRLVARLGYETLCYDDSAEDASTARDYGHLADSRATVVTPKELSEMGSVDRVILYTDRPEEALRFLQVRDRAVLLVGIRESKERELSLRAMLKEWGRGIVIDLYDQALLFSKNDNLYIYRSTV